jgi:hypothetical protein
MCFNAAAARSYLLHYIKTTDLILAGRAKAQIEETIAGDSGEHWPPHLMFFYSETNPATWGAGLPGSPILGYYDPQERLTTFVVAVQRWSDGTEHR